jgi:hypothetical protein
MRIWFWAGLEIDELTNVKRWLDAIEARPACQRGAAIPVTPQAVSGDDVVKGARTMLQR